VLRPYSNIITEVAGQISLGATWRVTPAFNLSAANRQTAYPMTLTRRCQVAPLFQCTPKVHKIHLRQIVSQPLV
jgi:hypothetical protein